MHSLLAPVFCCLLMSSGSSIRAFPTLTCFPICLGAAKVHTHTGTSETKAHTNQTHTLKLQMESANLSSTTDESRVQRMSLEWVGFCSRCTQLPSSVENVTRFNMKHSQREKNGPKRLCITRNAQVRRGDQPRYHRTSAASSLDADRTGPQHPPVVKVKA